MSHATGDVRIFREGKFPFVGSREALTALDSRANAWTWEVEFLDVSPSGDLAYSYGTYKLAAMGARPAETGNFLRIWRKDGHFWKIAVDLAEPDRGWKELNRRNKSDPLNITKSFIREFSCNSWIAFSADQRYAMHSVALICTANRCRSVIAHAILASEVEKRSLPIEVYSAGVLDFRGAPPVDDTLKTCLDHETPSPKEEPTYVSDLPLDSITRFLVMENFHLQALVNQFGVSPDRVTLLGEFDPQERGSEIDDPFGRGSAVYKRSYLRIRDCILNYLDTAAEFNQPAEIR